MGKGNEYWIYKAAFGCTKWPFFNAKFLSQLDLDFNKRRIYYGFIMRGLLYNTYKLLLWPYESNCVLRHLVSISSLLNRKHQFFNLIYLFVTRHEVHSINTHTLHNAG